MATIVKRGKKLSIVWRQEGKQFWRTTGGSDMAQAMEMKAVIEATLEGRSAAGHISRLMTLVGADMAPRKRVRLSDVPALYNEVFWELTEPAKDAAQARSQRQTLKDKKNRLENDFLPWMEKQHPEVVYMHEMSPKIVGEYWAAIAHKAKTTRNNTLSQLSSVWDALAVRAELDSNPWKLLTRAKGESHRLNALSLAQVRKLCQKADEFDASGKSVMDKGFWGAAIRMGFYTGLRQGDIVTLESSEIHRDKGLLWIKPNKTKKWDNDAQVVHMLHAPWVKYLPESVGEGHVWPEAAARYDSRGHVFGEEFRKICAMAGIEVDRERKENEKGVRKNVKMVTFHSLRHTFVTMALNGGASDKDIQKLSGHSTIAMMDHYNHQDLRPVAERVLKAMPAV